MQPESSPPRLLPWHPVLYYSITYCAILSLYAFRPYRSKLQIYCFHFTWLFTMVWDWCSWRIVRGSAQQQDRSDWAEHVVRPAKRWPGRGRHGSRDEQLWVAAAWAAVPVSRDDGSLRSLLCGRGACPQQQELEDNGLVMWVKSSRTNVLSNIKEPVIRNIVRCFCIKWLAKHPL